MNGIFVLTKHRSYLNKEACMDSVTGEEVRVQRPQLHENKNLKNVKSDDSTLATITT